MADSLVNIFSGDLQRVITELKSSNVPLLAYILLRTPAQAIPPNQTELFNEILSKVEVFSPALNGPQETRKRGAEEAELMGEEQEEHGTATSSKKKKTSSYTLPQGTTKKRSACDNPCRALAILLLDILGTTSSNATDFGKFSQGLLSFNAYEADAALRLLECRVTVLSLSDVLDCVRYHGYFPSAARCVELLLRVPEDLVYHYRRQAFKTYKRLRKPTATGVSMDTFLMEMELLPREHDGFLQAVKGYLEIDPKSGEVVACPPAVLDQEPGRAQAEEFVRLVDEKFQLDIFGKLLADVCNKLPRVVAFVSTETVLDKLLRVFDQEQGGDRETAGYVTTVLRYCSVFSKAQIAREICRYLREATRFDQVCPLVLTLLRSSLRLLLECDKENITSVLVDKVTTNGSAAVPGFPDLLKLFHFLVSRGVREVIVKGEEDDDLEDDDAREIFTSVMMEREGPSAIPMTSDGGGGNLVGGGPDNTEEMLVDAEEIEQMMRGHLERFGMPPSGGAGAGGMPNSFPRMSRRSAAPLVIAQNTPLGAAISRQLSSAGGGEQRHFQMDGGDILGTVVFTATAVGGGSLPDLSTLMPFQIMQGDVPPQIRNTIRRGTAEQDTLRMMFGGGGGGGSGGGEAAGQDAAGRRQQRDQAQEQRRMLRERLMASVSRAVEEPPTDVTPTVSAQGGVQMHQQEEEKTPEGGDGSN